MNRKIAIVPFLVLCAFLATTVEGFAQGSCTRVDLQSAVDSYIAVQRTGNPASLPLAPSARYVENTVESPFDKGILKSALKIDFHRSLLDTAICETFTEVIVTDDSCNVGVPSGMILTNRRFIADPETGSVVGFMRWPSGVPDSHLFRVENGKLRFVHSLTVCTVQPNCGFPQRAPAAGRQ